MAKAGYEYLLAYKITVPIYDLTVAFCERFIAKYSRTKDQMEQVFDSEGLSPQAQTRRAARSGMQNVAEGNKQQSLKGYIKLSGVSRGSLEELLKDYLAYARQHRLEIWPKEKAIREIREIGEIWEIVKKAPALPNYPNFPNLPDDPTRTVNLMITLVNQANYLLDKLIASLKEKHAREGGLTEELYRKRIEYRSGKT